MFHPTEKDNPTTIAAIKGAQVNAMLIILDIILNLLYSIPNLTLMPPIMKDKLEHLHQKWKQRIELQEREVARKSLVETSSINGGGVNCTIQGDITNRTAMWLEGADNLLSGRSSAKIEIEDEMKAISILIEQAPGILENLPKLRNNKHNQSCPKLPIICTSSGSSSRQVYTEQRDTVYTGRRKGSLGNETDSPNSAMKILASLSSQAAPVPIDTTNRGECVDNVNNSRSAIADAQTFVDFLQSVNR